MIQSFSASTTLAAGGVSYLDITVFLLSIGVLLGTARIFGEIARKLGQPTVLGEILAGVVLGKTILATFSPELYEFLFPTYLYNELGEKVLDPNGNPLLTNVRIAKETFLALCVSLLLLVAGLEVDLSSVWRQGKAALSVSLMGMIVPFALGTGAVALALGLFDPQIVGMGEGGAELTFALFIGIAMSITALPVIAKILMDLNLMKSDLGMLIMSSAMVNDLIGWVGFAIVLAMMTGGEASDVLTTTAFTLLFVGGMLTVGRFIADRSLPYVQAHTSWPSGVLAFVMTAALLCAAFTEWIGIHSIFGAFIAGVAIGDSRHLRAQTRETIEQFVTSIFAPIFFATIALRVNFAAAFDWKLVLAVLVIAIAGKLLGCYFAGRWSGMDRRQSAAVGVGMCARGAMEIILGQLALDAGLITEKMMVAIVVMAVVTSLLPGPLMQRLLQRTSKRSLADVLSAKAFAPRLAAATPEQAIVELCGLAARAAKLDPAAVSQAVTQRERMQPSGLAHGVAVPHARIKDLKRPQIAMGLSDLGIDFDAADGKPAEVICLLLAPDDEPASQLEMLQMVATAFPDRRSVDAVLACQSFTELKAHLGIKASESQHEPGERVSANHEG